MDLSLQLRRESVADIGYRDLVAIPLASTVGEAVTRMQEQQVGCLCITEGEHLRGIFTERNLAVRVLAAGRGLDSPIGECMTADPVTCRADEPLHEVLTKMHQGGFRHVPVVDQAGRPLGTLSVKRAVHFLRKHLGDVVYNVSPDAGRFPDRPEGG